MTGHARDQAGPPRSPPVADSRLLKKAIFFVGAHLGCRSHLAFVDSRPAGLFAAAGR